MSKVYVISLGCDKNRVDTENILYTLVKGGYSITDEPTEAEVIIINTCAFISSAEKESLEYIFDSAKLKLSGVLRKIIVCGCLPMRYKEGLKDLLPEVDEFVTLGNYGDICAYISGDFRDKQVLQPEKRILSTPPHYAYLKIAEGCDNHCTYCTIPSIRGKYVSRTVESLISEAKFLDDCGVKELILVAQDVTNYGKDLYGEGKLIVLLRELIKTCSFEKLRLLYCYPELVTDELIDLISNEDRIAKYIDVPLQHISNPILKRMGRRVTEDKIKELFSKLKSRGIAVRTTFIVGFPNETEEDYNKLLDFVAEYKPERVGVFAYSKEDGTPASKMSGQVPRRIKIERVDRLGELALKNAEERNASFVGKTISVIYESIDYDKNLFVGRSEYDAPDIDSLVYFKANFVEVGNVYNVKITGYDGYDLIGEINEFTKQTDNA